MPDDKFFQGGQMGALMRAKDWSATPLGAPNQWPQSLTTAVRIILQSRYAMFVWWGKELINLYNDSYVPFLGKKHPAALGRPASEAWSDIWTQIGPRTEAVLLRGESTYDERLLLMMNRHGFVEETYFTFSYSPLPNDEGQIGGLFCAVSEDTERVIGERRLRLMRKLASKTSEARTPETVCRLAADCLKDADRDLPFALIYLYDANTNTLRRMANVGIAASHPAAPETITLGSESVWPMDEAMARGTAIVIDDLASRMGDLPTGAWIVPPHSAFVMPLAQQGQVRPMGVLVAAANPHLKINEDFHGFVTLLAGQLAAAIANANAYEAERKRAEALAELDRAKTAFFSNVSHEFRTPITLLLGPLEEALGDSDGYPAKDVERLETAHRNGLRLLKLVNSLLDFSRIEAGREQASFESVDIASFTADLASGFRSLIERAGLKFQVDCPPIGAEVFVDREMWEKIILNLLSNAYKFTLQGGIRVTQQLEKSRVVLRVSDTGNGIPERELPNVFKRFHRIEGARGRSFEGTGIGLALVQELVKLHGGTVTVESKEGKGTTFTVSIPVGSAHLPEDRIRTRTSANVAPNRLPLFIEEAGRWSGAAAAEVESLTSAPVDHARPAVLVVDDNADMRDYIGRLLGDQYEVQFATNGEQGAQLASAHAPDLVLTDVMMPALDGVGMVRRLRHDEGTRTVPIIMLSARAGEEARVAGLESGADDYLTKPFTAVELLARVATHIKMAQLRKEAELRERGLRAEAERVQKELQVERKRLSEVFRNAPAFIAVLRGPDFVFEMTNTQYQLVIGNRNVLNLPLKEALPEVEQQGILNLLRGVYESGEPYLAHGFRVELVRTPDGPLEECFLDFVYQPVRDTDGNVSRIIVLGIDATERHRAQEALIRSEKLAAMGRLAASIAHEINNPLASVTNLLYLIERSAISEEVRTYTQLADQELRRVTQIATQTLRFHRQASAPTEVMISQILGSVLMLYQGRLLNAGIRVENEFDDQRPVFCLEGEVRQALTNMITNAVDAMPHGGRLLLRTREVHNRDGQAGILTTIADTGEGMLEAVRRRLFEPFFTTKGITGTGLGLWISKGIVDKHSGRIRVKTSQEKDRSGTVFHIFLPYDSILGVLTPKENTAAKV